MDKQIKHFSHEHPLQLKELKHNVTQTCAGCEKSISSGPFFYCNECKYFLHKSCAELRPKIKHPLHPQHPLTLLSTAPYRSKCYMCNECRGVYCGFVYHCDPCEYDLDKACACAYLPHDGHTHAFIPLNNSQPFVCYACGNKEGTEDSGCLCKICRIRVHSSCAELPKTTRKNCHEHPLKLTYWLLYDEFEDDITCGACNGKMSSDFGGYFCSDCKFASHLKCPKDLGSETPQDDGGPVDVGFSMPGHDHLLRSMEELTLRRAYNVLCDVCVQPITSSLFYCSEDYCDFLVHKRCFELPGTKQHKLHPQHPLTLLSEEPISDGIYRCDRCKLLSNGFVYYCEECELYLDVICGALPDTIQHQSHTHPLVLEKTSIARECKGCSLRSKYVFVCHVCDDFAIDCGCATLPSKAWHIYDKHDLSLMCFAEGGDLREYKCGICKEKIGSPDNWFYYCDECDFGGHPCCVLGKSRRVKFGRTFQYDFHPHPLTLLEQVRKHPPCKACGEPCNGWTLECGQCKCYFHRDGQCYWKRINEREWYPTSSGTMEPKYAAGVLATIPNVTNK